MPWYINLTRRAIRATKADGSFIGFDPRVRVWVPDEQISSEIEEYVKLNKLRKVVQGSSVSPSLKQEDVAIEVKPNVDTVVTEVAKILVDNSDVLTPALEASDDEESNMLGNNDIEEQPKFETEDGATGRERRKRHKRH